MKILNHLKLNLKKEKVVPFTVFLVIVTVVFFVAKFFNLNLLSLGPVVFAIVLSILCLIAWFMAGIAVFRSLVVASVSMSVIIFLAQTYCALPNTTQTGIDALKGLFGFGMIYSAIIFIDSLYKELMGDKNKGSKGSLKYLEEIYDGKKPLMILIPYAIFIGLFIWQLYDVLVPIIHNLCIY